MIPVNMISKHDPDNGTYGDCLRACMASLLNLPAESVPHFLEDGTSDGVVVTERIRKWLSKGNMDYVEINYRSEDVNPQLIMNVIGDQHYILTGSSKNFQGCNHCVVGRAGEVVHDPSPDPTEHLDPWVNEDGIQGYSFMLVTFSPEL